MIIIKLWGGLGNQLFQYAYGYTLAKALGTECILDLSFFYKQNLRKPIILEFDLKYSQIAKEKDIPHIARFFNKKNINRLIRIPTNFDMKIGNEQYYLKETRFKYNANIHNYKNKNAYIDGYWQCPNYFKESRDDLINQYKLKRLNWSMELKTIIAEIESTDSVAVHIRHGDYLSQPKWYSNLVVLKKEYYKNVINEMKLRTKNPKFYFFTDDPNWVKEHFSYLENSKIVSGNLECRDIDELILISKCKHQIIANSTFSWWGAWLNQNPEKIVFSPSQGWGNNDILPDEWIRIKNN